jgi:hypothetical protein
VALTSADVHAKVTKQRYFADATFPSTIAFERSFGPGRAGRTRLFHTNSVVEVATSREVAVRYVAVLRSLLNDPSGDFTISKTFARELGETDINSTLEVGRARPLKVGESSLALPLRAEIRGRRTDIQLVVFQVERLIGALAIVGAPGSHLSPGLPVRLAKLMTGRMAAELAPKNVALPVVSGAPEVGQTLTSSSGLWNGTPTRLGFRWQRCNASGAACVAIAGATSQTYTPTAGEVGSAIRVSVTARNRYGATTVQSATTATVGVAAIPANLASPTIVGTAQVGQNLTASTGTWSGAPTSFSFQWQHCDGVGNSCVAIPGATSGAYAVAAADSGGTIRVAVTASNAGGSATAVSAPSALIP